MLICTQYFYFYSTNKNLALTTPKSVLYVLNIYIFTVLKKSSIDKSKECVAGTQYLYLYSANRDVVLTTLKIVLQVPNDYIFTVLIRI